MKFYGFANPAKSPLQICEHIRFKEELLIFFLTEKENNLSLVNARYLEKKNPGFIANFPLLYSIYYYYSSSSMLQDKTKH